MALTSRYRAGKPKPRDITAGLLTDPRYELIPVQGALEQAASLPTGATVTITASSRRGTEATVALAEQLAERGFRPVPHLAARQIYDEGELTSILRRLEIAGVRDAFVVGGDAPTPAGVYADGLDLLRAMDGLGHSFEQVGVPSYPEGHHAISDDDLWESLQAKQKYATYTVTQLCFHSAPICQFAAAAAARGITLPVIVGIPGVVHPAKLLRIGLRVGVGDSLRFARHTSVARRMLRPAGYRPEALLRKLAGRARDGHCDIAGTHIYTFNDVAPTVAWVDEARRRATRQTRRRTETQGAA